MVGTFLGGRYLSGFEYIVKEGDELGSLDSNGGFVCHTPVVFRGGVCWQGVEAWLALQELVYSILENVVG